MGNIRCIVIGEPIRETRILDPIEMVKMIDIEGDFSYQKIDDYDFDTIELVSKSYGQPDGDERGFDIMFGYCHDNRSNGVLFLGYWNDGVA